MKRIFLFLLILCCLVSSVSAAESLFTQANNAYLKGRYKQAANLYLELVHKAGISAELLDSLADSYAASGQTGLAVLNYERALRLTPSNPILRSELQQLRREMGLHRQHSLPKRLAERLGADQWLLISGTAFVFLSLTILAVGLVGRKRFPWAARLSLLFLFATLLPLPPALFRYQSWQDGVVINNKAELLISPFDGAQALSPVKEGCIIRPLDKEYGTYTLVRDQSGQQGWLDKKNFQRIADVPL